MTEIIDIKMYKEIIKEQHLILICADYCGLSKYFLNNIDKINFKNKYIIKNNNNLFKNLLLLNTPTIIYNKKLIYPDNIEFINKIK